MKKRVEVYYSGSVQGVGFRFQCRSLAEEMGVRGSVSNTASGGVEMVAEAEEDILKEFLNRIDRVFAGYINNYESRWSEATGGPEEFVIKR